MRELIKKFPPLNVIFKLIAILMLLSSCNHEKSVVLFQVPVNGEVKSVNEIKFKSGDLLGITLFCEDLHLNGLFNISASSTSIAGGYTQGAPPPNGFIVDEQGDVLLPLIGKINVVGMTKTQLSDLLRQKLLPFVKDPLVSIRLLNFKVTVIGEVYRPGTIYIPSDRVTIFDALAICGDLQITARRDNVLVIREVDGKRKEFRLNLTNLDSFNSEAFYLQQNDVVYVAPNRVKANSAAVNNANISLGLSALSVFISFLILVTR